MLQICFLPSFSVSTQMTFPPLIPVMFFFKLIFNSLLLHVLNAFFWGNFCLSFLHQAFRVQAFIQVEYLDFILAINFNFQTVFFED